jgi:hypothetical protein
MAQDRAASSRMERMARIALLASVTVGSACSYCDLCLIDNSVSRWPFASRPTSPASSTSAIACWWSSPAAWCPRRRQQIESAAAMPASTALLTAAERVGPSSDSGSNSASSAKALAGRTAGLRPEARRAGFVTTSWPSASQSSNEVATFHMVRVPATNAKWATWKRYCDAVGLSMGRAIADLIDPSWSASSVR